MRKVLLLAALLALPSPGQADDYTDSVLQWQKQRDASLRRPDSWLTLAGLHWLKPGRNRFGSESDNELVFPKGPGHLGELHLEGQSLGYKGLEPLTLNGQPSRAGTLDLGAPEGSQILGWGSLRWFAIHRDGRWAIRLKDEESEKRRNFKGMHYFPVDPAWRVRAQFEPFAQPQKVQVVTAAGTEEEEVRPGELVFAWEGKPVRVVVVQESEQSMMLNFGDASNGQETYGAGRYLYFSKEADGTVWLDFNRAYTPPCAFTHFATCSLAPPQNRLPFRVTAGEKAPAPLH